MKSQTSTTRVNQRRVGLVPAIFTGAPASLVLASILSAWLTPYPALLVGAIVGTFAGRCLLKCI